MWFCIVLFHFNLHPAFLSDRTYVFELSFSPEKLLFHESDNNIVERSWKRRMRNSHEDFKGLGCIKAASNINLGEDYKICQ